MPPSPGDGRARILVILGPTAVGKTGLALSLAERVNGEIVSADSAQVYRHMDIGTDKPVPDVLARVRHHLVDVCDPDEPFSVADFQRLAVRAVEDITARGRLPMVVGGTGLYIRALTSGFRFALPGDPSLRRQLALVAEEKGPQYLHDQLRACDPRTAAEVHPANIRRVIRALEVYLRTGIPISSWKEEGGVAPFTAKKVGLTRRREELYRRIEARVEDQLRRGLVDEARRLLVRGYSPDLPAMQALGYKEVVPFVEGRVSYEEMVAQLKRNTRRYAKRQWTWFKREPDVTWFDLSEQPLAAVEQAVIGLLGDAGWTSV